MIFPLRSWVTLARNPDLVDPAFRGTDAVPGPVVQEASPLAAARSATPERQENGAVTLDVFAAAIEEVIEGLKLATGRVLSAERDPSPTDIWAVSFIDPGGITQVDIAPTSELEELRASSRSASRCGRCRTRWKPKAGSRSAPWTPRPASGAIPGSWIIRASTLRSGHGRG
ncbi:hypothetical protein ACFQ4K_30530 [Tistrella bauzanensis]